jgi:hypothetical protein
MRPVRLSAWGAALAVLALWGGPAQAAWNNVFQVCCHKCRSSASASPIVSYYAPQQSCCAPPTTCCAPPPPVCTTRYVQRSFYRAVTTYKQETFLEPVTTYRTSFFWEPVTCWRHSCYFDPCTCSYQQVATPVTSYRLRSQCCPVTSYLQRCALKPVTSWQQVCYYEPVTTCCNTTTGAPVGSPPVGATVVPEQPTQPTQPTMPPGVREEREASPSGSDSYKKLDNAPKTPYMPPVGEGSSSRQPQLRAPVQAPGATPTQAPAPPKVRLDRIASIAEPGAEGSVVRLERPVRPGAKFLFVSTDVQGQQRTFDADEQGQIRATLATGGWLVYLVDKDGKTEFQQRLEVRDNETKLLSLVKK